MSRADRIVRRTGSVVRESVIGYRNVGGLKVEIKKPHIGGGGKWWRLRTEKAVRS